jgi:hypothetical protein
MKMKLAVLATLVVAMAAPVRAQVADAESATAAEPKKENDGTDPTQLSSSADVTLEHLDLRGGFGSQTLAFGFTTPITAGTSLRFRAPLVANDVFGNDSLGLGDVSIKLTRVLKVTRQYGIVVGGELAFDTAERLELGSGKTVFKANFVYAKFLKGGSIFAPALVHSISVAGKYSRADVNSTTIDFYYVPRLKNKKLFMTVDPAIIHDWENDKTYGSVAVTFGQKLGKMFGGNGQIFVKPSVLIGSDRGANWGAQAGFKVLNF